MAINYTDVGAVQAGGVNILANLDDPNLADSRVALITATYTMTGNEAANDQVYIARVPSGALVNPIQSNVAGNGIATTATLSVGDSDTQAGLVSYDPARYSAAQDVHAANTTTGTQFSGGTVLTSPAEITDDWVWLIGTFATMVTPVAGKKLIFRILVSDMV